jgi:hypothetical protein
LERVKIEIPPKDKILLHIPIVEDGDTDESFYDFAYNPKTDSILSGILEIFLREYIPVE